MESMLMGTMAAAVAAALSVYGPRARSVAERCVGFFMLRVRPRGRRAAVTTTSSAIENGHESSDQLFLCLTATTC